MLMLPVPKQNKRAKRGWTVTEVVTAAMYTGPPRERGGGETRTRTLREKERQRERERETERES